MFHYKSVFFPVVGIVVDFLFFFWAMMLNKEPDPTKQQ